MIRCNLAAVAVLLTAAVFVTEGLAPSRINVQGSRCASPVGWQSDRVSFQPRFNNGELQCFWAEVIEVLLEDYLWCKFDFSFDHLVLPLCLRS